MWSKTLYMRLPANEAKALEFLQRISPDIITVEHPPHTHDFTFHHIRNVLTKRGTYENGNELTAPTFGGRAVMVRINMDGKEAGKIDVTGQRPFFKKALPANTSQDDSFINNSFGPGS